jgi:hypothetical protein
VVVAESRENMLIQSHKKVADLFKKAYKARKEALKK